MTAPHAPQMAETADKRPVTVFGPGFPFPFDDWIKHPAGLACIPGARHGEEVAIIGAGMSGMVAAFKLMKMGLKPVIYEAGRTCGTVPSPEVQREASIITPTWRESILLSG